MTNLPIASNNLQPAANSASTQSRNGVSDAQSAEPFGKVLARQMDGGETSEKQKVAPSTDTDDKKDQGTGATAEDISSDPANNLIAMLHLPQDAQRIAAKDTLKGATAKIVDLGSLAVVADEPSADVKTKIDETIDALVTADRTLTSAGKAVINQIASAKGQHTTNIGTKIEELTAISTRSDVQLTPTSKQGNPVQITDQIDVDLLKDLPRHEIKASGVAESATLKTAPLDAAWQAVKLDESGASLSNFSMIKPIETQGSTQSAFNTASSVAMTVSGTLPNMQASALHSVNPQTITSHLASANWPEEFSQKISWMGTQQNQVASLHLNPPDLGPLDIVLKISGNQATALFTSPHGAVRDAVENALPRLRETLAEAGITLGNATVSDQSLPNRDAGSNSNQGSTPTLRETFGEPSESSTPIADQTTTGRRHNGLVDIFA